MWVKLNACCLFEVSIYNNLDINVIAVLFQV